MGLLDNFSDPSNMGLLSMGATMLQNGGPSLMPRSTGQILGSGINAGLQTKLLQEAMQQKLMNEWGVSPVQTEDGQMVQLSKNGDMRALPFKGIPKTQFIPSNGFNNPMIYNQTEGTVREIAPTAADGQVTGSNQSNLTGADYLATIPADKRNTVKGMADGTIPISPMLVRTPGGQALLNAVSQYDPNFDAVNYQARAKTRQDFTSGKSAQAITSFNTVLGHMDNLDKAAEKLNNSDYQLWNKVSNAYESGRGDPRVQNFNAAKNAVTGELTKAFNNGHVSDSQLKEWGSTIDSANSPEQLKAATRQLTELLGSKINALGEQYSNGMGKTVNGISLLTPHAQESYNRILGKETITNTDNSNSKFVDFNGKKVMANKAADGNFYVLENGNTYKVKE